MTSQPPRPVELSAAEAAQYPSQPPPTTECVAASDPRLTEPHVETLIRYPVLLEGEACGRRSSIEPVVAGDEAMIGKAMQLVASIVLDPKLQSRARINEEKVLEYAEILQEAEGEWPFPPLELVNNFLVDGWHRLAAAKRCGWTSVPVNQHLVELSDDNRNAVRQEALRRACAANATHGLQRSDEDKRRAVLLLLEEFADLSDRKIAQQAAVSPTFVGKVRRGQEKMSARTPNLQTVSTPMVDPATTERLVVKAVANEVNAGRPTPSATDEFVVHRPRTDGKECHNDRNRLIALV